MQAPPDSPLDAAVAAHAIARGFATPAQLEQARRRRATFAAAGQQIDLLAALGPSIAPPALAELRAFAAGSGRAATPPGGIPRGTPPGGTPAVGAGAATLAPGPAPQPQPAPRPQVPFVPFGSHPAPPGQAPPRTPPAGVPRRVSLPGAPLGPGDPVGPYVVVKELARGGMGAVYIAEQPGAGRRVALKVRLGGDLRGAERFFIEGRAAAKLRHPGVVRVHDVGTDERGRQYLAMDLVEGQSLESRVNKEGPLPDAEVARIGLALAQALASAHAEGILHRDLKPANVLLRAHDGAALLTDFGLAKQVQGAEALTRTGDVLGTPNYMPPEQANGRPADARSDVWGLGATLWHLLVGRAPFEGGSVVAVLAAVLKGEVVRPRAERPEISPALEAVVLRCMTKQAARRYQSMTEVAADLQRFLAEGTTFAASDERKEERRRRARAGLIVGGALLGLAGGVGLAVGARGHAAADVAAVPTQAPTTTPATEAPATEAPATEEEAPPPPPPSTEPPPATTEADMVAGQAWVPVRTILEAPPPRWGCGMVYDARRRVVVLFGGTDGKTAFDDTWTFDGAAWKEETPSRRPPGRYAFAMAWDAARSRAVVHGGALSKPRPTPAPGTTTEKAEPILPDFDDLWEWDGARWTEVTPKAGGGPGARAFHAAAWDPKRSRCVLFGGPDAKGTLQADLWGWDGTAWTALPAGPGPAPVGRQLTGLAWDVKDDRLVVVGGAGFPAADELWSWRPDHGWSKAAVPPLPGGPGPRQQPVVVAAGPDLLVYGGSHGARRLVDTWSLEGDAFTLRVPDLGQGLMPPPRKWQAAAWDAGRGVVVLFGGHPPVREPPVSTWLFRPR